METITLESFTHLNAERNKISVKQCIYSLTRLIATRLSRRNELLSTGFASIRTHKLRICEKRRNPMIIHSLYIQFVKEL
jgi:hypothetical protein